jgi:ABC-type antimicrobial peptide transport system permease subunit
MLTATLFILKDMRHDLGRTLLGMLGLAVVIFSYQVLISMADTFAEYLAVPGVSRNLIVTQAEFIDPSDASLDPAALEAARSLEPEFVQRTSPVMFRQIRIGDRLVALRSAPMEDWENVFHLSLTEGRWPTQPFEVVVGEGAARANHWTPGSVLEIYGSPFHVSGIFRAPGASYATVWMPFDQALQLFGTLRPIQGMYVQVADGADVEEVRARLQADPRLSGKFTVFLEDTYTYRNNQFMKDFRSLMLIASGLALLAVVFGTFTITSLSLVERGREIAILRSVGFTPGRVQGFLLLRALLQGLLAYLLGLSAAWVYVAHQQTGDQLYIQGLPISFQISAEQVFMGALWMGAMAILGAWLSSRWLQTVQVASLLRDQVI